MKTGFFTLFLLFFFAVQMPVAYAGEFSSERAEADQLYLEKDFKKAGKIYYKLAKDGDHFSQGRFSHMLANGEGRRVDLEKAYAWSVLAEEGGASFVTSSSAQLLQRIDDKPGGRKAAEKMKAKYGKKALVAQAQKRMEIKADKRSSSSMGSNLSR